MMRGGHGPSGSDLAGVGTAMITSRAVPAPLPGHHRRVAPSLTLTRVKTLPTPWSLCRAKTRKRVLSWCFCDR